MRNKGRKKLKTMGISMGSGSAGGAQKPDTYANLITSDGDTVTTSDGDTFVVKE